MVSGGRIRVDVDVDAEQIAHGARVLGAVGALERTEARVGIERRGAIDPRLERRGQLRAAPSPSGRRAPGGGIMPDAQRANHPLGRPAPCRSALARRRTRRTTGRPAWRDRCGRSRSTCLTIAVCCVGGHARQARAARLGRRVRGVGCGAGCGGAGCRRLPARGSRASLRALRRLLRRRAPTPTRRRPPRAETTMRFMSFLTAQTATRPAARSAGPPAAPTAYLPDLPARRRCPSKRRTCCCSSRRA